MRHDDRLSGGELLLWTTLGVGAGLVAGFALSEWIGGVNRRRVGRVVDRLRDAAPSRLTTSASVRAVETALQAEPRLAGLTIELRAVARGAVELRGWVPNRLARTVAGRVALAAPGIESVINSILVRGEDDRVLSKDKRATDQSA
ncbi:MAG: BON domain-containing protein [Gemmatimonadales bacterium]